MGAHGQAEAGPMAHGQAEAGPMGAHGQAEVGRWSALRGSDQVGTRVGTGAATLGSHRLKQLHNVR